ncbi:cytochrome c [Novosphingobium sp. SG720]|uniref:c-type cytochrome n=1 Tax=Novosphingobium sp. SG720 TaxID=2586998 RepID=UPI001446BF7C|nr:cytochrome c [Novosphingobium sp. SG720]NKJ42206.1 mono/diheme cytochrome c family protein [Novosphingobium sp. SG720]
MQGNSGVDRRGAVTRVPVVLAAVLALGAGAAIGQARPAPAPVAGKPVATAPVAALPVYRKWCADCHATPTGPGSLALQRKYQGAVPAILEQRSDLSPDYVRQVVRQGISFMPSFRKTEISDAELAAVATYLTKPPARRRSGGGKP